MATFGVGTQPYAIGDDRVVLVLRALDTVDIGFLGRPAGDLETVLRSSGREDSATFTLVEYATGQTVGTLPVIAGSAEVTVQEGRQPRRMFSCSVPPAAEWLPTSPASALHPLRGLDVVVTQVVEDGHSGRSWSFPLGRFALTEPRASVDGSSQGLSLTCPDVSWRFASATTAEPVKIPADTRLESAVALALGAIGTTLPVSLANTGATVPAMTLGGPGGRVWAAMVEAAKAAGHDLYVTAAGTIALVPAVGTGEAVATWQSGRDVLSAEHALQASDVIDAIRLVYPTGVEWWPAAISVGRIVDYDGDTSTILSQAQALKALEAQWVKRAGVADSLTVSTHADPRREPGETVQVDVPELGVSSLRRIASMSLRVPASTMNVGMTEVMAS